MTTAQLKSTIISENATDRETLHATLAAEFPNKSAADITTLVDRRLPVITSAQIDEELPKITARMEAAFREDRARLFKVIDGMRPQPRFADKLTEIEAVAQTWRDLPDTADFPNITHPAPLPEWFENVRFFSRWEKDRYIIDTVKSSWIG